MSFLITLEGVLKDTTSLSPDISGIHIYDAFCSVGRVTVLGSQNRELDEWFLKTQGLNKHATYEPYDEFALEPYIDVVKKIRGRGDLVDLVVSPDPSIIARLHEESFTTLLYLSPKFSSPEHRPDYKPIPTAWSKLSHSIDEQQKLRAEKVILQHEEAYNE